MRSVNGFFFKTRYLGKVCDRHSGLVCTHFPIHIEEHETNILSKNIKNKPPLYFLQRLVCCSGGLLSEVVGSLSMISLLP